MEKIYCGKCGKPCNSESVYVCNECGTFLCEDCKTKAGSSCPNCYGFIGKLC